MASKIPKKSKPRLAIHLPPKQLAFVQAMQSLTRMEWKEFARVALLNEAYSIYNRIEELRKREVADNAQKETGPGGSGESAAVDSGAVNSTVPGGEVVSSPVLAESQSVAADAGAAESTPAVE